MAMIIWDDAYQVGIDEIDRQHRGFVEVINKLQWAFDQAYPKEVSVRLVYELMKYAEYHFVSEENLMFLHQYPKLEAQVKEHQKLIALLQLRVKEFNEDRCNLETMVKFTFMWFISHTTEEDKKFGDFMRSRPAR